MEEDSGGCIDPVIETLTSRGWCLKDLEQAKAMVMIHSALADDGANESSVVDSVESELSNMDLKSIGGKSLPEPSILRKSYHLLGPKVLQISSVRDVSRSSLQDLGRNSGGRRLLRLGLTDGITEITAIEYSDVPAIPDDVVPGTKVRLQKKVVVRSGIVCLNPKVITLIGGVVPSLYEEWQMNKKYSGFSRSSSRLVKESNDNGPPSFEKLQLGGSHSPLVQKDFAGFNSKNGGPTAIKRTPEIRPIEGKDNLQWKANGIDKNKKPTAPPPPERTEEKPSSSEARLKEVAKYVPVQNQAASQKLLQKLNNQNQNDRRFKGGRYKGKEKREEPLTYTLDEWERRKTGAKPLIGNENPDMGCDEDLAWQLQNQFDLEDSHVQRGPHNVEAEDIRMSMFNYRRDDNRVHGAEHEGGGRGRGRGRGWGKGRGGGRGRWREK